MKTIHSRKAITILTCIIGSVLLSSAQPSFKWANNIGGSTSSDRANDVKTDKDGNIFLTGKFEGTVDFNSGGVTKNKTSLGRSDGFIAKYDTSGAAIWVNQIGGTSFDECKAIAVDGVGNVYVTGYFIGTVDFDPSSSTTALTSKGFQDVFLAKYTPSGQLDWVNGFGSSNADFSYSVKIDRNQNVLVAGTYRGVAYHHNSQDSLVSTENNNVFILKYNSAGSLQWQVDFGGKRTLSITDVATDQLDNIFAVGSFEDSLDINPSNSAQSYAVSNGSKDVFLLKLDKSGVFIWGKSFGGTGWDRSQKAATDKNNNLYHTGYFRDTVDVDPNSGTDTRVSNGGADIFAQKLDGSGNVIWTKTFGGSEDDISVGFSIANSDSIFITGYYKGTVDFDPGSATSNTSSAGDDDIFIQCLDNLGNFKWVHSVGGTQTDRGIQITNDLLGNVLYTGWFEGSVDFDPSTSSHFLTANAEDMFMSKMSYDKNATPKSVFDTPNSIAKFHVFPNPARERVTVITEEEFDSYAIYDLTGTLFLEQNEQNRNIDLRSLCAGQYVLIIKKENDIVGHVRISKF